MFKKSKDKRKRIDWKINRTVQDTIPYKKVYEAYNLIETSDNVYCRAYILEDLNFSTSKREDQEAMFINYQNLLNSYHLHSFH